MKVPFASRGSWYDDDDKNALLDLLDGPPTYDKWATIRRFESDFNAYLGSNHALSVSSCTAALHLCLKGIDIQPGDEIITTPLSWVATSNTILFENARPVFVDVEPDTLNMDVRKIDETVTARTRAILPVHFAGHPADLDPILQLARENSLSVIGDAAHAVGAQYKGKKVGSIEDLAAFSFYTQKNMSTLGEGGMVTARERQPFERIQLWQNHGVQYASHTRGDTYQSKPWFRDCVAVGLNYRMGEAQAAVGITQLRKLRRFNDLRRERATQYSELLADVEGITSPVEKDYAQSSWHLYVIKIEKEFGVARDQVVHELRELGVGTNVHYTPIHYFKPYQDLGYRKGDFPVAEEAYEKIISLPLYPGLSESQVGYVVECLARIRRSASSRGTRRIGALGQGCDDRVAEP